jgi:hypothetical protein
MSHEVGVVLRTARFEHVAQPRKQVVVNVGQGAQP